MGIDLNKYLISSETKIFAKPERIIEISEKIIGNEFLLKAIMENELCFHLDSQLIISNIFYFKGRILKSSIKNWQSENIEVYVLYFDDDINKIKHISDFRIISWAFVIDEKMKRLVDKKGYGALYQ